MLGGLSWHATFGIYLVGIPLAAMALWSLPDTTARVKRGRQVGAVRLLRERPALIGWYGLWILVMVQMYVLAIFLAERLAQIGISVPVLVSVYAVVGAAVTTSLVGLVYGRLRARLSYAALLRIAFGCALAGFVLYGTVSQPLVLLLAPALFGVGNGILFPVATVLVDEAAGVEHTAASGMSTASDDGGYRLHQPQRHVGLRGHRAHGDRVQPVPRGHPHQALREARGAARDRRSAARALPTGR